MKKLTHKEKYDKYITSKKWENRRKKYYKTHERKCSACGSTSNLNLHHHTYERMGKERDSDLVPLCSACHEMVHYIHRRSNKTLTEITFDFIKNYVPIFEPRGSKVRVGYDPAKLVDNTPHKKLPGRKQLRERNKRLMVCRVCGGTENLVAGFGFWVHKSCTS